MRIDKAVLVAHDAGGAEILSLWAKQHLNHIVAVLEGPAISVFDNNLTSVRNMGFSEAMALSFPVITGTSWQSDLEKRALFFATQHNIPCFAILDHWVNYKERLLYNGTNLHPSEVWCFDDFAKAKAETDFPYLTIRQYDNPYLNAVRHEFSLHTMPPKKSLGTATSALYLAESIDSHMKLAADCRSDTSFLAERQIFQYFLSRCKKAFPSLQRITVRPHPAHKLEELSWMYGCCTSYNLRISNCVSLTESILNHDLILGLETMAMVVALQAGKHVITVMPPNTRQCVLPFPEIQYLSKL